MSCLRNKFMYKINKITRSQWTICWHVITKYYTSSEKEDSQNPKDMFGELLKPRQRDDRSPNSTIPWRSNLRSIDRNERRDERSAPRGIGARNRRMKFSGRQKAADRDAAFFARPKPRWGTRRSRDPRGTERVTREGGKGTRSGVWQCDKCNAGNSDRG